MNSTNAPSTQPTPLLECPWCGRAVEVPDLSVIACPECLVSAPITDPVAPPSARRTRSRLAQAA